MRIALVADGLLSAYSTCTNYQYQYQFRVIGIGKIGMQGKLVTNWYWYTNSKKEFVLPISGNWYWYTNSNDSSVTSRQFYRSVTSGWANH